MKKYILAVLVFAFAANAEAAVNPEVIKALKVWATERIAENAKAARREQNVSSQVVRTFTGISIKDIKKNGIWGGRNSFFRKPFG
jgi:hypothetical protein